MPPYHFSVTVHEDFSAAVTKTRRALEEHGFGIVSEIDLAAIFKEKLGLDHKPHLILGACNPEFARKAIEIEPAISVLLPCQVVIRHTDGGGVVVDFMDPAVLIDLVGEAKIHDMAEDVRARFEMVRDAVATTRARA